MQTRQGLLQPQLPASAYDHVRRQRSAPSCCKVALFGCCRGFFALCVICGVHPPAPVRVCVGRGTLQMTHPSPAWSYVCCFAHVRPCAQGRCGQCPHGSGVTRRKQHRPGTAPNDNTTHVPTAGSSAALTKPNHTPTRHPHAKGKTILLVVTPHAA